MPSYGVHADNDEESEEEVEDAEGCRRHERKAREKGARRDRERRSETMRRRGRRGYTNAVGGSRRRNDYRPRTHSLPAIISSTNATKSIRRPPHESRESLGLPRENPTTREIPLSPGSFTLHMQRSLTTFKFKCRVSTPRCLDLSTKVSVRYTY